MNLQPAAVIVLDLSIEIRQSTFAHHSRQSNGVAHSLAFSTGDRQAFVRLDGPQFYFIFIYFCGEDGLQDFQSLMDNVMFCE